MLRQEFQVEHGQYIPEDFCLHVENLPNRWAITTLNNEQLETLPSIADDVVEEVSFHEACDGDVLLIEIIVLRQSSGQQGQILVSVLVRVCSLRVRWSQ